MRKFKVSRLALAGILAATLPMGAQAGFGFGFDSDNGFYDYDPEDYWRWGGYPPSAYRDYDPSWRWGSRRHSSGWRFGSKDDDSGWHWDGSRDWGWKSKDKDGKSSSWWYSRSLKDDDGWTSWGREWSFGREGKPTRFNFGSFDFGDRWSPSFGKKSWSFGRKPRWRPGWGYPPPPAYPGWGIPYAAPWWGANPYAAPYGPATPSQPSASQPSAEAAPAPGNTGEVSTASAEKQTQPADGAPRAIDPTRHSSPPPRGSEPARRLYREGRRGAQRQSLRPVGGPSGPIGRRKAFRPDHSAGVGGSVASAVHPRTRARRRASSSSRLLSGKGSPARRYQ